MVTMLKTRKQLNKLMAHTEEARRGVQAHGEIARRRAAITLSQSHGAAPHAYIADYMGKTDYYIILNDTRGQQAAVSIEYGRRGGTTDKNGRPVTASRAVAPLRKAVGLQ
jgi:hypothetical protein